MPSPIPRPDDPSTVSPHPRAGAPTVLKIMIAGGFGAGKTTAVGAVSEITPLSTEEYLTEASADVDSLAGLASKRTTTVAFDFGRLSLPDAPMPLELFLFGTPGQDRFVDLWYDLSRGAVGAVVLVDTRRMDDSWYAIDRLEHHRTPFVVAVNRFDDDTARHSLDEIRLALALPDHVPLIDCDARVRTSGKHVLVTLVDHLYQLALAQESAS